MAAVPGSLMSPPHVALQVASPGVHSVLLVSNLNPEVRGHSSLAVSQFMLHRPPRTKAVFNISTGFDVKLVAMVTWRGGRGPGGPEDAASELRHNCSC